MYVSTLRGRRGIGRIGDDGADQFSVNIPQTTLTVPSLPPGYADTATFTGLPITWEIGLGLLGALMLFKFTQRASKRVSAGVRAARRAR
jgi:hypothetical protein